MNNTIDENGRYSYDKYVEETHPKIEGIEPEIDSAPNTKEALIGILLGIGYMTVFSVIPLLLIILFFGDTYTAAQDGMRNGIAQSLTAIIVIVLMAFTSKRVIGEFKKGITWQAFGKGFVYSLITYVIVMALGIIDVALFGPATEANANQSGLNDLLASAPVIGILFACILAPLIEELIFRYYIFRAISKKNVVLAFVVVGLLFGCVHMLASLSTLSSSGNWKTFFTDLRSLPVYIAGGLIYCFVYYKTKTLAASIFSHMCYNTIATIFLLYSFSTTPLKISDVATTSDSISFALEIKEATVTDIELFVRDENKEYHLFLTMDADRESYEDLTFTGLDSDSLYIIKVTYAYDSLSLDGAVEVNQGTIQTWAATRGEV